MKKVILAIVLLAVVGVVVYKLASKKEAPKPTPAVETISPSNQTTAQAKSTFYLFHDPSDQDAGCRRIYSFADRAEQEYATKFDVKRPDVEKEKSVVEKYQVKVLPTILIVSPTGEVKERFEGEDKETVARLEQTFTSLKEASK